MMPLVVLMFIVAFVGAPALVWYAIQASKQRQKDFAALAESLGMTYAPADPARSYQDARFHLFQCGHSRNATNIIVGTYAGIPLAVFDYAYVVGHGKDARSHFCSAVLLDVLAPTPYVSVHRKGFFDKIAHFLGLEDITIGLPEFDARYHIKSQQPEVAARLLTGGLAGYVLQESDGHASIELCDGRLLVERTQVSPTEVTGLLDFAKGVRENIPSG